MGEGVPIDPVALPAEKERHRVEHGQRHAGLHDRIVRTL
jgi:hypothetical protein